MNSSPEITVVAPTRPDNKPTVPEMCLLYHLIAQSALNSVKLRAALQTCTPEQRAFLHDFFVKAASK